MRNAQSDVSETAVWRDMSLLRSRAQTLKNTGIQGATGRTSANVERELKAFMGMYGITGRMPSTRELQSKGANSLYGAIHKHGGFNAVAARLGLPTHR